MRFDLKHIAARQRLPISSSTVLCALLLTGCSTVPTYAPSPGSLTATMTLKRGDAPSASSHAVRYYLYGDSDCRRALGFLGAIFAMSPEAKTVRIESDQTVYLRVVAFGQELGGPHRTCHNILALNLRAGGAYNLTQHIERESCRLQWEGPSNQTAIPFTSMPVTDHCKKIGAP